MSSDEIAKFMGLKGRQGTAAKKPTLTSGGFADMMLQTMKTTGKQKKKPDSIAAKETAHANRKVLSGTDTQRQVVLDKSGIAAFPITHKIELRSHDKTVSALDVDRTGSRLITGSMDYTVKIWQFAAMDSSFRPYKTNEPHEGYPVNDLSFSPSGTRYVASISHRRPLIFNGEGKELAEFVNGDVYLHQESKTRGHTAKTSTVKWAADDEHCIISSSCDGTVRLWDPAKVDKRQTDVFVHGERQAGKQKAQVFHADLNGTMRAVITAGSDGRVVIWGRNKGFTRPDMVLKAHIGHGATSAASTADGRYITTRGLEGSVKLFDTRKHEAPLATRMDLETFYDTTNVIFGGADKVVVTGTGADPRSDVKGRLVLLNAGDLSTVADVPVAHGSISKVLWPSSLNQIFVGSQDGACHVYYNPTTSMKGVLLGSGKHRVHDAADSVPVGHVINPNSEEELEKIMEKMNRKGYKGGVPSAGRDRQNPKGKMQPSKDPSGSTGPQQVTKKTAFLQEYCPDLIRKNHMRNEDPRAALLAVSEEAAANPQYVDTAYSNQPKLFADPEEETENEKKGQKRPFGDI
eukprot:TRINITY_DN6447_c0_g1_i1.p1 TRINITY_DN6447_c0_g1~~TRINITY_DN6447_c0_g1_i1.p1  ORF type:complete len:594 (+),score=129.94 TRINITY_DN6447_c0_g1_i1:58-1782(+)